MQPRVNLQKINLPKHITHFLLKSRVDYVHDVLPCPCRPVPTRLRHDVRQRDLVHEVTLDEVEVHAFGRVPCDVAVEGPYTRAAIPLACGTSTIDGIRHSLVQVPLEDRVSQRRQRPDVAARRVLGVLDRAVPVAEPRVQDLHVVPVKVHGVHGGETDPGEVDADAGVVAPVVHGAETVENGLAQFYFEEERVVEVAEIGDVVHPPDEGAGVVVAAGDDDVDVEVGIGDGDGVERGGEVERVVLAGQGRNVAGGDGDTAGRVGRDGRVGLFVVDGRGGYVVEARVDVAAAGA